MAKDGSKAKIIRDFLDQALELKVPNMSPEDFLREFGIHATADEIPNLTLAEVMMRQLVMKAAKGSERSIDSVMDRLLGKPMQQSEHVVKSYSYYDLLMEYKKLDEGTPKELELIPDPDPNPDPMADFV